MPAIIRGMNKLPFLFATVALTVFPACSTPATNEPEPTAPTKPTTTATNIDVTAQWLAAPDNAFGAIAVASTGDKGAIAYAELEGENGSTRIKLQRLDSLGAVQGAAIELGITSQDNPSRITLATDGIKYIACWAGNDEKIACASAPIADGNASAGLSMSGRWPSIVFGASGWALAYGIAEQIAVVKLANDGTAMGNPALFAGSADSDAEIILKSTDAGFALLGESAETMKVFSLNKDLLPISAPVDLGKSFWFHATMATSGTNIGVVVGEPYGCILFMLDGKMITGGQEFNDNWDKTGANTAIGADDASFGILSANYYGGLSYGLIDEGSTMPPSNASLDVDKQSYHQGSLALMKLSDDHFLAASQGEYSRGGKIVIGRVHRSSP